MPGILLTVTHPASLLLCLGGWLAWTWAGWLAWTWAGLAGMDLGGLGWHGPGRWPAGTAGARWPGGPGHYARTHDRGAVVAAGGARHPGDAQRAARARLRHRTAHRARRRAGPDLAHPPAGRLPV